MHEPRSPTAAGALGSRPPSCATSSIARPSSAPAARPVPAHVEGHGRQPRRGTRARSRSGSPCTSSRRGGRRRRPHGRARGRAQRAGQAVVRRRSRPAARLDGAHGVASCRRRWRPRQLSHVWPLGSRINAAGHLELGGCDARRARPRVRHARLRRRRGRPARPRARVRRRVRRAHRRLRGALRLQGVPLHRGLARVRRGGHRRATSPRAASCAWRCAPASTREDPTCTATPSPRPSCARRSTRGVGTIVIDNLDELERLERARAARRAPARPTARHAQRARRDARRHLHRPGRLEVRRRARRRARRDRAHRGPDRCSTSHGLHMHIGSQILDLAPFRAAVEAVAPLGDFPEIRPRRRPRRRLHARQAAADDRATTPTRRSALVHELLGADMRLVDEPGRALVANSCVTLYTVADGQAQRLHLGRRRRRHVRQPAPDALRRALRGARRRPRSAPTARRATWSASTASPAT